MTVAPIRLIGTGLAVAMAIANVSAFGQDKVTLGTNWKAQAEHGGWYQAVANGTFAKHGLDVTIRPGGPQVNNAQLLAGGRLDFNVGSALFSTFNFVKEKIPMVTVAAFFQKDPQCLVAHPGQGNDTIAQLKGKPILISTGARTTYWQFLKVVHGFQDEQIRPYTFNMAPFLADKSTVQQCYVTSEPFKIEKEGGFKPVVHLLADSGYDTYAQTIETSAKNVRDNPSLVQRFIDASIQGWASYLTGDPTPGNLLIKKDNPDMTDEQIAYSLKTMKAIGIVDSGDAKTMGIGAMTDARVRSFFDTTVKAGMYPADLQIRDGYTLQFVNKKFGM
jgi:NitT/TauT family transport system substrate-binding protein